MKKSKKANLESKRAVFFELGIIVALSFVLLAFEWTTIHSEKYNWDDFRGPYVEEDLTQITVQEQKKPIMPKPIILPIIIPVDDNIEVDDTPEIDAGVTVDTQNDPDFVIPEEDDDVPEEPNIFLVVEEQPSFPGGLPALYKYLAENLRYPEAAHEVGISGPVSVDFVVWKDGSIRMVKVRRGIGGGCDEEAFRVIENMPNWNPGKQRSKVVNVRMNIPIVFKLN